MHDAEHECFALVGEEGSVGGEFVTEVGAIGYGVPFGPAVVSVFKAGGVECAAVHRWVDADGVCGGRGRRI